MMQKDIFEKIYEKPGAIWTRSAPPKELTELIEDGEIKPCKALDIGCGEGFYSIYLASKGFDVTGIDFSEKAIEYAKKNAAKHGAHIMFIAMNVVDLPQLKEKFDFVLEWGVLHHIMPPQRQRYIKNVANILNRGGKYLSICFNVQDDSFGTPGEKYKTSELGTKLYFSSQDELEKLFQKHFSIMEAKITKITGRTLEHIANFFLMEKE